MPGDGFALGAVSEQALGQDANQDGDQGDQVLAVIDLASGASTAMTAIVNPSLPFPGLGYTLRTSGPTAFLGLDETLANADLNGDGDLLDLVAHVYDRATGVLTNLAHAIRLPFYDGGDGRYLYLRSEADDGGQDLNGDGDPGPGAACYGVSTSDSKARA